MPDWQDETLTYSTTRSLRREIVVIAKATEDRPEAKLRGDSELYPFLLMGSGYAYALADLLAWLGTKDEALAKDAADRVSCGLINGYDDDWLNDDVMPTSEDGAA
jgi:hypothetical protein